MGLGRLLGGKRTHGKGDHTIHENEVNYEVSCLKCHLN